MPAWPSYAGLSPRCRAGFLQWLAGGRRDPGVHDGFPLLLLAGLERRLLEIGIDDGHPDVDCITTEVRALLDVYGPRRATFGRCARSLLTRVDSVRLKLTPLNPSSSRPATDHQGTRQREPTTPRDSYLDQELSSGVCRTASYSELLDTWPVARHTFNRKMASAIGELS